MFSPFLSQPDDFLPPINGLFCIPSSMESPKLYKDSIRGLEMTGLQEDLSILDNSNIDRDLNSEWNPAVVAQLHSLHAFLNSQE